MRNQGVNRRTFLAGAAAGAGTLLLPASAFSRRLQLPLARDVGFGQGVASGQPTTNGITLWTKLDGLSRDARLQVEISPDADFRRVIYRKPATASAANAYAVHHRAEHKVLQPGERYYYRFVTCTVDGPVGRFQTARPADSREPVRIAFFSCQDYESGYYTAHAALAKEPDIDFAICLGDYIYEKHYDDAAVRKDSTGANGDAEVQTLPEYRDKYALYHSDADLRAVRAAHPLLAIWDDHEVEDNWARDQPGTATDNPRVAFPERRANGFKAFFEHQPRIQVQGDRNRIYGAQRFGANAEVFLLDQRSYRDDQPCGDQFFAPCPDDTAPGRTLLGAAQKEWLVRSLADSKATWKIVGNQVMIMSLDVPAGNAVNHDQWDGYAAERREILERVSAVKDITFVTGDIHTFFAGRVTPSGRQGPAQPAPVATEFVGGSITSKGVADSATGEGGREVGKIPADATLRANNPHFVYSNQSSKGYAVLEAKPNELLVTYKGVGTTQQPTSAPVTLARFRVPRGQAEVETLAATARTSTRSRRRTSRRSGAA
jgi:alkaline phosphatase D